ncbi:MAG: PAS domain S-box protein [Candidatus Berkelbacteria bacterium]
MQKKDISKPKIRKKAADDTAILVLNKKTGKILDANTAAKKLFKKTINEIRKYVVVLDEPVLKESKSDDNSEKHINKSLVSIFQKDFKNTSELLDMTLTQAIKLTESVLGYVYYYHEDTKEFVLNSWSNEAMKQCSIQQRQTVYMLDKTGLWGEAVRQRKAIMVNDYQMPNAMKKGYPAGHAPLNKFLTVPVFEKNKIVAVVGVANKKTDYGQHDIDGLNYLMTSVWIIVKNLQSVEEQKKLISVINSSNDAIIAKKLDGTIQSWSKGAEKLYGYKAEEMIGKNISEIIPDDKKGELAKILDKIAEGENVNIIDTTRLKKDGKLINVALAVSPIFDEQSKIVGASSIAHDISERIEIRSEIEDQLREQEKLNRLMIGRELKMIELKKEILELKSRHGHTPAGTALDSRFHEGIELEEDLVQALDQDYMKMVIDSDLPRNKKNTIVGYLEVLLIDSRKHEKALEDLS